MSTGIAFQKKAFANVKQFRLDPESSSGGRYFGIVADGLI